MYGLQMFDSWLYDDKKPFIHLDCGDVFEELRKAMDTDYYEQLIRDFFLDNTHVCYVGIEPKAGLTAKMDQEEPGKTGSVQRDFDTGTDPKTGTGNKGVEGIPGRANQPGGIEVYSASYQRGPGKKGAAGSQ